MSSSWGRLWSHRYDKRPTDFTSTYATREETDGARLSEHCDIQGSGQSLASPGPTQYHAPSAHQSQGQSACQDPAGSSDPNHAPLLHRHSVPSTNDHWLEQLLGQWEDESEEDDCRFPTSGTGPTKHGNAFEKLMQSSRTAEKSLDAESCPGLDTHEKPADESSDPFATQQPKKSESVPVEVRKSSLLNMSADTREHLNKNFEKRRLPLLEGKCDSTRCWLHPAPNPKGRVHVSLCWRDIEAFGTAEPQSMSFEYGAVFKLLAGTMTPSEREGWVNDAYHLSHLCGNATCCNPAHHVIESATANGTRKACHNRRRGGPNAYYLVCKHDPPCLFRTTDGAVYVPKTVKGEVQDTKPLRQATLSFGVTKSEKVANPSKALMSLDSPLEDVAKDVQDTASSEYRLDELKRRPKTKTEPSLQSRDLFQLKREIESMNTVELLRLQRQLRQESREMTSFYRNCITGWIKERDQKLTILRRAFGDG